MENALNKSRVLRFACVGVGATSIHIGIVYWFVEQLSLDVANSNVIAFMVATMFAYIMNTLWSFRSQFSKSNAYKFVFTSVVGSVLSYSISSAVESLGGHYLLGIACIVFTVPALSFCAHHYWTYKQ